MVLLRSKRPAGRLEDRIVLKTACKTEETKHVSHMTRGECTFQILHAEHFESLGKVYEFITCWIRCSGIMVRKKTIYILNVFGNINLSKLVFTNIYYTTKTIMSSFRIWLSNIKTKIF